MCTAGLIIFVIILIFGIVTITTLDIRKARKREKDYQEYVDSIQIGDTFAHDDYMISDADDPFSENYSICAFDPLQCVTIIDIKKNYNGETWVKYRYVKAFNDIYFEWTDEIHHFLKHRTRLSKRIDNINTSED